MREIIFRGKRLDNGEWVSGNLFVSDTDGRAYILAGSRTVTIEWEIDPSTGGQYTGLKDKNGKMIFEQDILGSRYDDLCPDDVTIEVVKWFRNGWYVQEKAYSPDLLEEDGVLPASEIIGNAYDTPELLKEEDET